MRADCGSPDNDLGAKNSTVRIFGYVSFKSLN